MAFDARAKQQFALQNLVQALPIRVLSLLDAWCLLLFPYLMSGLEVEVWK
jgi:hypothetical protein